MLMKAPGQGRPHRWPMLGFLTTDKLVALRPPGATTHYIFEPRGDFVIRISSFSLPASCLPVRHNYGDYDRPECICGLKNAV